MGFCPETRSFSNSTYAVIVVNVNLDLLADTDRNGTIDSNDETGKATNTTTRGALIPPPLRLLVAQPTSNSLTSLATIKISVSPTAPAPGMKIKLKKKYEPAGCTLSFVLSDGTKLPDISSGQAYSFADWPTNVITLRVQPQYARPLTTSFRPIRFDLELQAVDANDKVLGSDVAQLKVAPMILPPECNAAQSVYSTENWNIPGVTCMNTASATQWAQDMVKFVKYQVASGQTKDMCVDLDHPDKGDFLSKLRNPGNWDGVMPWVDSMRGDGGSIMATPSFGTNVFGAIMIGDRQDADYHAEWQGQGIQPVITVPTDWLYVGHVDEILMWVATNKVLYADPWKAADLLHQEIAAGHQTNGLWYGTLPNGTNCTIQQVVIATGTSGYKLTTLPLPGLSNSTLAATLVFTNAIFALNDILRVDDEILQVTTVNGPTVTVARAQATRPAAVHVTGSVIYAYNDLLKDNLPVGTNSVIAQISNATNRLQQALGTFIPTFVPIPVLFPYVVTANGNKYFAGSANAANCLLGMGGTIYYSKTGCNVFRDYISSVLPTAQEVPGVWNELHCYYGEIHCGTAAQRQLNLAAPWWQQVTNWE